MWRVNCLSTWSFSITFKSSSKFLFVSTHNKQSYFQIFCIRVKNTGDVTSICLEDITLGFIFLGTCGNWNRSLAFKRLRRSLNNDEYTRMIDSGPPYLFIWIAPSLQLNTGNRNIRTWSINCDDFTGRTYWSMLCTLLSVVSAPLCRLVDLR